MIDENSGHGVFPVKLEFGENGIEAVLTGDYFGPDEIGVAKAMACEDGARSVANGGSPVYLVRDSVVKLAVSSMRRALRSGASDCTSGTCGEPCGDCETCSAAEREVFTRVILGALELPDGDLSERLRDAVSSVIGLTWSDAPWEKAMTEEEAEEVFVELGVEKANRKE